MKYGDLPTLVTQWTPKTCPEMFFYQYLPIKMVDSTEIKTEPRLSYFNQLISTCCQNFIDSFGWDEYDSSYIYLTCKNMYQVSGTSYNRLGWHSDGFGTDDINYIWSDRFPTVFNYSDFELSQDDTLSLAQMERQAKENWTKDKIYDNYDVLRLNQYNIHRVGQYYESGMRCFAKISFSKSRYSLFGNSHNYEFDYNWNMKQRDVNRNQP